MSGDDSIIIPGATRALAALLWVAAVALLILGTTRTSAGDVRVCFAWAMLLSSAATGATCIAWLKHHLPKLVRDAYTLGEVARELSVVPKQR